MPWVGRRVAADAGRRGRPRHDQPPTGGAGRLFCGGVAALAGLALCWEYPPAALPAIVFAVGFGVASAPGYDEAGRFNRKRRERFATACYVLSFLGCVGLLARALATHPAD